jgi:hypothetical protein
LATIRRSLAYSIANSCFAPSRRERHRRCVSGSIYLVAAGDRKTKTVEIDRRTGLAICLNGIATTLLIPLMFRVFGG